MLRGLIYVSCIAAFAAIIIAETTPEPTVDPEDCGTGAFTIVGGKCVFIDPFLTSDWDGARFFCQNLNSDLVSIDSIDFYMAILDFIRDNSLDYRDYWIGGRDGVEGVWFWVNGERVDMGTPFWAVYGLSPTAYAQEPTDSALEDLDCLRLDSSRALYFDDFNCNNVSAAICQRYL